VTRGADGVYSDYSAISEERVNTVFARARSEVGDGGYKSETSYPR
jgi:hypothetical protein